MFYRSKVVRGHEYLQIVHPYRDNGRPKQRVVASLGRLDRLKESGQLESLLASGARFSAKVSVVGEHERGELEEVEGLKIGPGMVFGRLWKRIGISECLGELLQSRRFRFDVERAIFLTVTHRLMDPGSDRAAEKWRQDHLLPGVEELELHQLYRAMAWLGEELPESDQHGRTPFAPRCVKDLVEERLFGMRRDLFSELSVVLFDTTSLYFEGRGGETLGQRGKSKDHRPDCKQMVIGLVVDGDGRPVCCELWPGNTSDVKTLIPIVDRLRTRFRVGRICVVADRGMISQEVVSELESRTDLEYILGARMRRQKEVNEKVLARAGRYHEVHPNRERTKDPSPLKVKEVVVDGRRYVVCSNEEQARKDAADREQILSKLEKTLKQGDKALVGNKGFKRYLKSAKSSFQIDQQKIKSEARLDGKWVLRTNSTCPAAEVALTYKLLWMVEDLNRSLKSLMSTRPVYHRQDETIRGHVFCSFLSLMLMRELQDQMDARGWGNAEWADVLRDLDMLQQIEVEASDGKRFVIRTAARGWSGKAFQAAGVALPPTITLARERSDD